MNYLLVVQVFVRIPLDQKSAFTALIFNFSYDSVDRDFLQNQKNLATSENFVRVYFSCQRCAVWWTLTVGSKVMRPHKPGNLAKNVTVE